MAVVAAARWWWRRGYGGREVDGGGSGRVIGCGSCGGDGDGGVP